MPLRAILALLLFSLGLPTLHAEDSGPVFDSLPKLSGNERPPTLDGRALDDTDWRLADHRDQVVLVVFWAAWCGPCLQEMPGLTRLAERLHGRPFALVGVNAGDPELRVRTLVRQLPIGFPLLLDPDGTALARWGVPILPTAYLVDGRGQRRLAAQGPVDWDDPQVLGTIEGLIGEIQRGSPPLGPVGTVR